MRSYCQSVKLLFLLTNLIFCASVWDDFIHLSFSLLVVDSFAEMINASK